MNDQTNPYAAQLTSAEAVSVIGALDHLTPETYTRVRNLILKMTEPPAPPPPVSPSTSSPTTSRTLRASSPTLRFTSSLAPCRG